MDRIATSEIHGDETVDYEIVNYTSQTVNEFIKEVLKNTDEWGCISVGHPFKDNPKHLGCCEYKNGVILSKMSEDVLNKKIKRITACGGWTLMDYTIITID